MWPEEPASRTLLSRLIGPGQRDARSGPPCRRVGGNRRSTHGYAMGSIAGEDMIRDRRLVAPTSVEPVPVGAEFDPDHADAVTIMPQEGARARSARGEVGEGAVVTAIGVLDVIGAGQRAGSRGELGAQFLDRAGVQDLALPGADRSEEAHV